MLKAVHADEDTGHEPPVSVECVWRAIACVQVRPSARKVQVRLSDHPLEVGDSRRIEARVGEMREGRWGAAVGRLRHRRGVRLLPPEVARDDRVLHLLEPRVRLGDRAPAAVLLRPREVPVMEMRVQ